MVGKLVCEAIWVTVRQARGNGARNRLRGCWKERGALPEVRKTEICVPVAFIKGYESWLVYLFLST